MSASQPDQDAEDTDQVRVRAGAAWQMPRKDLLIRFAFGASVSLLAAIVSAVFGPFAGGAFLAFPAILLASLTLVAKEEGLRSARDDARGAALGTLGLLAFSLLATVLLHSHSAWLALTAATAAWLALSLAAYALARVAGKGGDEPRPNKQHFGRDLGLGRRSCPGKTSARGSTGRRAPASRGRGSPVPRARGLHPPSMCAEGGLNAW